MKILINLLPEDRKKEEKRKKKLLLIVWQESIVLFIVFIFLGLVVSTNFILKIQLDSFDEIVRFEQSQSGYKELQEYENEFKQINSKISLLYSIKNGSLYWLNIFYKLDSIMPKEILLTDLVTKDYRILIAGNAKTREDLLKFKDTINNSGCFTNVNIPTNVWVIKEDVNFQMDFDVSKDCLKGVLPEENKKTEE